MAITWRNIDAPSSREAMYGFQGAQSSINSAFSALSNVLKREEDIAASNVAVDVEMQKQNFLDVLANARTPEELAALQDSGQLNAMRAALNPAARAATRGAEEARVTAIRQNITAENLYKDSVQQRADRPIINSIQMKAAKGDAEGAAAELAANPSILNAGEVAKGIAATKRDNERFQFDVNREIRSAAEEQRRAKDHIVTSEQNLINLRQARTNEIDSNKRRADTQAAEAAISRISQSFQQKNDQNITAIQELARKNGLPMTNTGMPDFAAMTVDQAKLFNTQLKDRGLDRVPSSSEQTNNLRNELIRLGVSPSVVQSATATGDALFKNRGVLSSEDQAEITSRHATIDAIEAEENRTNLFYTPPKQLAQAKIDTLAKVEGLIKDGPMTRTNIREKLTEWMDTGIEINIGGKKTKVPVPPKVVEAALMGGAETDTWFYNNTDNNTEKLIKTMMTDPSYDAQRVLAEQLLNDGVTKDKNRITQEVRNRAATNSSADLLSNFESSLKSKLAEAKDKEEKAKAAKK